MFASAGRWLDSSATNADDEQFLTELCQALSQEAIDSNDPRYVHAMEMPEVFGPDVVRELGRDVRRSTEGSVAFLTGTRGSGKSTQVLRLRDNLAESGYAVVYVSLEEYLNLHKPVEVVEVLYAMVGSMSDAFRR